MCRGSVCLNWAAAVALWAFALLHVELACSLQTFQSHWCHISRDTLVHVEISLRCQGSIMLH